MNSTIKIDYLSDSKNTPCIKIVVPQDSETNLLDVDVRDKLVKDFLNNPNSPYQRTTNKIFIGKCEGNHGYKITTIIGVKYEDSLRQLQDWIEEEVLHYAHIFNVEPSNFIDIEKLRNFFIELNGQIEHYKSIQPQMTPEKE